MPGERMCLHLGRIQLAASPSTPALDVAAPVPPEIMQVIAQTGLLDERVRGVLAKEGIVIGDCEGSRVEVGREILDDGGSQPQGAAAPADEPQDCGRRAAATPVPSDIN